MFLKCFLYVFEVHVNFKLALIKVVRFIAHFAGIHRILNQLVVEKNIFPLVQVTRNALQASLTLGDSTGILWGIYYAMEH